MKKTLYILLLVFSVSVYGQTCTAVGKPQNKTMGLCAPDLGTTSMPVIVWDSASSSKYLKYLDWASVFAAYGNTQTLAETLTEDNKTGENTIISNNTNSELSVLNARIKLDYNGNYVFINNDSISIKHDNIIKFSAPTVAVSDATTGVGNNTYVQGNKVIVYDADEYISHEKNRIQVGGVSGGSVDVTFTDPTGSGAGKINFPDVGDSVKNVLYDDYVPEIPTLQQVADENNLLTDQGINFDSVSNPDLQAAIGINGLDFITNATPDTYQLSYTSTGVLNAINSNWTLLEFESPSAPAGEVIVKDTGGTVKVLAFTSDIVPTPINASGDGTTITAGVIDHGDITPDSVNSTGNISSGGKIVSLGEAQIGTNLTVGGNATITGNISAANYPQDLTTILTATISNGDTTHAPNGNAIFDALDLKANLASPALTGNPTAPTQAISDNTTKLSTTAYVNNALTYVTPEMFGAVGNGTTNDATALQATITYALANNKAIYLTYGKIYLTGTTLTTGSNLVIDGNGATLKTTSNISIISITGDYNMIKNVKFLGNSTGGAQTGIYCVGVVGLNTYRLSNTIQNCFFDSLAANGIYGQYMIGSSTGSIHQGSMYIFNNTFKSCGNGIFLDTRAEYCTLGGNIFYQCGTGVRFVGGNNNIYGGSITDCTAGIAILSGINDGHTTASNVKINHNATNIQCTHANNWVFSACVIYAGNISLTGTGKTIFEACQFYLTGNTLTITNSPTSFFNCEFNGTPTTYTLTGTKPIMQDCYSGTLKMITPNTTYMESAQLHLYPGTATAGTAPLKFTSGTNLTTPENGAVEYNGSHYYGTTGGTRYQLDQQVLKGNYTTTGTATTTFTVTIGTTMANTNYVATPVPKNTLSAVNFYVTNLTTTTFDIVTMVGLTGAVNFDYTVVP